MLEIAFEQINKADSVAGESVDSAVRSIKVILPIPNNVNQDSLWNTRVDSILKRKFPEAGNLKTIAVGNTLQKSLPKYSKSEFHGHLLKVVSPFPQPKTETKQDFSTIIVFGLLFVFGVLSMVYRKRVLILLNAFLLKRYANQIQREENALSQRVSVFLTGTFLLSSALLFQRIGIIEGFSRIASSGFFTFFVILGFIVLYFSAKYLLQRSVAFVLKIEKEVNEYLFNALLIHQIGGLFLFIIALTSSYIRLFPDSWVTFSTLFIFTLMFAFQVVRGLGSIRFEGINTLLYIFLYFCMLEVLPLVLLIKIIMA